MGQHGDQHRVGGRHAPAPSSQEGGGYLDFCTDRSPLSSRAPARDARLDELRAAGVGERWLRVAEVIGVDAWLQIWQILDAENAGVPQGARDPVKLRVPLYSTWLRAQRNKVIRTMTREGYRTRTIRTHLRATLGLSLSERHISRIASDDG